MLRNYWYKQVVQHCSAYQLEARKPDRFGHVETMTEAILIDDNRQIDHNEVINLEHTVSLLKQLEKFMNDLIEKQ